MNAGTREGVLVDIDNDAVWIYNDDVPVRSKLGVVVFDHWPSFELDLVKVKEDRKRNTY